MRALMMKSCSGLAMAGALVMAPYAAQAQSFQGTPTVVEGVATINDLPGSTFVEVDTASAVIDWLPDDTAIGGGDIDFQPVATFATFQGTSDFVVLNRVVPVDTARAIRFEGLVESLIDADGPGPFAPVTGGTVFFYSPGGIVVGQNALFDVGNLGLTTADPVRDAGGDWIINNQVTFQNANPLTDVVIERGAVLQALEEQSFIALFAPFIRQQGDILVNGQAALVAGEAGSITFSPDGLFDIEVTVGTDAFGIENDGIIGGPQSSGPGDNHRVYMVAIPKSSAISLAINGGSDIGFDVAGGAINDGDAVVLSAGFNISGGEVVPDIAGGGGAADIDINPVDVNSGMPAPVLFRSRSDLFANNLLNVDATAPVNFDTDASLYSADTVDVRIRDANMGGGPGALTVNGDLFLSVDDLGLNLSGVDVGTAGIDVRDGGFLLVNGDLILSARGGADSNGNGQAVGGLARLLLAGGSLGQIGGDLFLASDSSPVEALAQANSAAGDSSLFVLDAGTDLTVTGVTRLTSNAETEGTFGAIGGLSFVSVADGATFTTGELNMMANARSSDGPGLAQAGNVQITVDGDDSLLNVLRVNETGDPMEAELDFMSAVALGGTPFALDLDNGGDAAAGQVLLIASNGGAYSLPGTETNPLVINAFALAGDASASNTDAGIANGGLLTIDVNNTTVNLGHFDVDLSATGGSALNGLNNVNGGNATSGGTFFTFSGGADATLGIADYFNNALGGDASNDIDGLAGSAAAGQIVVTLDQANATFLGDLDLINFARGGQGGIGGPATGASISIQLFNNSNLDVTGRLLASAIARAGRGLSTSSTIGANGTSQFFNFFVADSTVSAAGFIDLRNEAFGGNVEGSQAGSGDGADVRVRLNNANIEAQVLSLLSGGTGGGSQGTNTVTNGGTGTAGNAFVINEGGVVDIDADITAISRARGGGAPLAGGDGADSMARAAVLDGTLGTSTTVNGNVNLFVESNANPAFAGIGGDALADGAQVITLGGDITINGSLRIQVERLAGAIAPGGTGGSALGNTFATVRAEGGNILVTGPTTLEQLAAGGDGLDGAGGSAFGGRTQVYALNALGGSSVTLNSLTINTTTIGGNGANGAAGGDATGGVIEIYAQAQNGELTINSSTNVTDNVTGGNGGDGDTGGLGGTAIGSRFDIGTVSGGQFPDAEGFATFQNVDVSVNTTGGIGGEGSNGAGGNGGDAAFGGGDLIGRGAPVTVGVFNASSVTTGGAGGDGSGGAPQGNGGNALAGALDVIFSNNSNGNTRGNLTSGDIFLVATAVGGQGEIQGNAFASTSSRFDFSSADATIDRYSFQTNGIMSEGGDFVDGDPVSLSPNEIILIDADVNAGEFNFSTLRDVSLMIDNSTLDTVNININVGDFVAAPAMVAPGLLDASNSLIINSMGNILLDANLVSGNELRLGAPGEINVGQLSGSGVVSVNSLGLITIDDDYSGDTLEISAADLVIGNDGGLNATSVVSIISIDPDGITVGAGLDTSTGFVIDDVMLGTVNAPVINLVAGDATSLNGSIFIDTIDLGILPQAGFINFAAPIDGTVSVFGNLTYSGPEPINVGLIADLVTVNSDTGGVNLATPDSTLFIEGRSLYVGEGATLDALLLDNVPVDDLPALFDTPTAISRPDGVLNAPNLTFQLANEIYIQNTGTAELPAGFVSTVEGSDVVVDDNNPDPPRVIVNGQFETDNGTLTGDDAANAVIEPDGGNNQEPSQFTEDSTINGCLFTTGCEGGFDEPDIPDAPGEVPPEEQATNTVNAEVQVVNEPPAVTTPASSENAADAAVSDAGLTSATGNDAGGAMGEAQPGEIDSGSANDDFAFDDDPVISDSDTSGGESSTGEGDSSSGESSEGSSESEDSGSSEAEESSEEEATEEEETEATEEEEEEAEEAAASGPIMPPVSLFTTQALDNPVDVNDPVSSAGNPALLNPDVATPPAADTGEAQ